MEYVARTYRKMYRQGDLIHFQVIYKETDLDIGVSASAYSPALEEKALALVKRYRDQLEQYICLDPAFATTLVPHILRDGAPPMAKAMADAAARGGVGPMAAVAGAFSHYVAEELAGPDCDIIIENGGDIYLRSRVERRIGIFAGTSPLSGRIALLIKPEQTPLGICTSSGTVGPSLSFGRADAAVILSSSAILADAVATAVGNVVQGPGDVEKGVNLAASIVGVNGALVIVEDKLAAWGEIELASV